ncbi:lipid IV(A) 3-deoxy-D-manno-octulosonic acid transferase [Cellvibrio sp. pealriver]|uniref:lipid IV(A) 3-deoxy-D-manno-octulosonic acid transferase n=1 Tax=Cellvibrio sp. pealriver TaxID=1622269 RepID=UPI00066FBA80|nr:lipid IV(A) 3-deoxy-D-manno-octulosonic acid transferase [Cellvibrio sp. pealriver]
MMRFLYTLIFYCLLPVILLRLLWRSVSAPAYVRRWSERFAFFPAQASPKKIIWLHTVSVGEFLAALPLIRRLQSNPAIQLVITTTTPTGSERVRATLGDSVFHVYAPYDLPDVIARFLHRINPSVYLVMETELWPNTLAACAKRNIPALLINGRLSAKSARGYARFSGLTAPMLQHISTALIQNHADAQRFIDLGLPQSNVVVTGNIKFDLTLSDELKSQAQLLKSSLSNNGQRLIWIAASTHQGEDEIILDAFAQLREHKARPSENTLLVSPLLILVPRHPERFTRVGQLCTSRGFNTVRRSSGVFTAEMDILLGDTMGELLLLFGASDIAFVGGSLVPNGGHNFIEPAAWGLPLLSGEHVFNFAEVSRLMVQADALQMTSNANQLVQALSVLIEDAALRKCRGENALRVAQENRGALDKTLAVIERYLQ